MEGNALETPKFLTALSIFCAGLIVGFVVLPSPTVIKTESGTHGHIDYEDLPENYSAASPSMDKVIQENDSFELHYIVLDYRDGGELCTYYTDNISDDGPASENITYGAWSVSINGRLITYRIDASTASDSVRIDLMIENSSKHYNYHMDYYINHIEQLETEMENFLTTELRGGDL